MSLNKGAVFKGDVTINSGGSTDLGFGDLKIARNVAVSGTTQSTSTSTGAATVVGGVGIGGNLFVGEHSTLQRTSISTNAGQFSVTGSNAIDMSVTSTSSMVSSGNMTLNSSGAVLTASGQNGVNVNSSSGGVNVSASGNSSFAVTGAYDLTMSSTLGQVVVESAKNQPDAVEINATNAAGGVTILGGTGGLTATMTDGPINLSSSNVASSWSHATNGAGQHLTLQLTGATTSRMILTSAGTTSNALTLTASAGGISMSSVTGLSSTVSNGPMTLNATGASSSFTNTSTGNGQNLTISLAGATASSLILSSAGTGATAININASASTSGMSLTSGTSGLTMTTTGGFSLNGTGVNSNVTLTSNGDGQTLTVGVTGTHDSKLVLSSEGTSSSAIHLNATNASSGVTMNMGTGGFNVTSVGGPFIISGSQSAVSLTQTTTAGSQNFNISQLGAFTSRIIIDTKSTPDDALTLSATSGGISLTAGQKISIITTDTVDGIDIGNVSNVPIFIGSSLGSTTVRHNLIVVGDLTVSGTTTTVDSEVVTVQDNIMLVNSAPSGSADGGMLIKRYQTQNDSGQGDVVNDTAAFTFTATAGTSTTVTLPAGASGANNAYNGYWLKISSGTGSGQVRRVKAYNGTTKVVTIYTTSDETASPSIPPVGANFTTTPDNTSEVQLFYTPYIGTIYQESSDNIVFAYAALDPSSGANLTITKEANVRVNNLTATGSVFTDVIEEYTTNNGVTISSVNINDGVMTGVTSINGASLSSDYSVNLVDNSTSGVTLPGSLSYGTYMVMVSANSNANGAFASFSLSGNTTNGFYINRMSSIESVTGESLNISQVAGSAPTISHGNVKTVGASGANLTYNVKIIRMV